MPTYNNIDDAVEEIRRVKAQIKAERIAAEKAAAEEEKKKSQKLSASVKYTLFASGLNYGGRKSMLADMNYKDNIAFIFDAVTSHQLTLSNTKTSYPVESKATMSDHVVAQDGKFEFTAYVASSPAYILDKSYFDQNTDYSDLVSSKRPQKAYDALKALREARAVVSLVTEDFVLTNYVITELGITRQSAEGNALLFSISLEEFRTATVGKTTLRTIKPAMQKKKSDGNKAASGGASSDKDIEFTEMKSRFSDKKSGSIAKAALEKLGIPESKVDVPAGVVKPDGTIVRY